MAIDSDSGEYLQPQKTYLDDVEIYDAELGGVVPAWKSLIFHGVKARHLAQLRNDSAGAIAEEASKGAPSNQPKLPPPLVADAASKDKDEASKMERVMDALNALEQRLDVLEEKKRQQQEDAARCAIAEKALLLAEQIAEETPGAVMDALPPAPNRGYTDADQRRLLFEL
jgi:hypothetical protein